MEGLVIPPKFLSVVQYKTPIRGVNWTMALMKSAVCRTAAVLAHTIQVVITHVIFKASVHTLYNVRVLCAV